ncbi:hypothetical protein LVD17_14410 [Fulvivirga ulvae]|uniref:hypothetical protein n=1 Tax=Fulvivirga ulvae TaxID=2904245 RepID=UPI001F2C893C|nr:hypothetical protein [Fulvivirga ulvae]UII35000.1 hypothetical protein LVD17_14410 [Fulvivirga ulvae]
MTNLEKFFGIKVQFKQILDPLELSYLKTKALNLTALTNFNIENFFVYVHTMNIHIDHRHFAHNMELKDRIKELEVQFCVNPKQVRRGQIRFYNEIADIDLPKGVEESYGDTQLIKYFPGTLLNDRRVLKTELITYIDKSLVRESHKKIKVHVLAIPQKDYRDKLSKTKREEFKTSIDLKFTKQVQLTINFPTNERKLSEQEYHNTLKELNKLYEELETQNNISNKEDLELILNAIKASEIKDESSLKTYLKNIGNGAFKTAKEIGLPIILELMKQ